MRICKAVPGRCSIKKVFLKISQNSQKNICVRASFLITLQVEAFNFIKKETLEQVFSCEFCKISKNTFLTEHLKWLLFEPSFCMVSLFGLIPTSIYLFKVNNGQERYWCCSGFFIVNFEHILKKFWTYFSSNVSIVDFEQENAGLVGKEKPHHYKI